MIERLARTDEEWVKRLFVANAGVLGIGDVANQTWYRYWARQNDGGEFWKVIRPHAFAHYRVRKDGWRTLYEIAVAQEAKGQGLGRRLVEHIGFPQRLKTDASHAESNAFYRKLGFQLVLTTQSKDGNKLLNHYEKVA